MSGICLSKTEYPRGEDRRKSVRGETTQMWGGSTEDYAGRIDFGADRPVFDANTNMMTETPAIVNGTFLANHTRQ